MPTWQVVMPLADLWAGELTGVRLGGEKIVLVNIGGEIRAFADAAPTWASSSAREASRGAR
jgi:toluene monooxygenase system ferredoxin subunit